MSTRLATDAERLAPEAAARLVAACRPERIWLFGSRARGEQRPDSDLDLLVVVPDGADVPAARQAARESLRLLGADVDIDLHAMSHRDFHDRLHLRASFPATVVREGRILYEESYMGSEEARPWLARARSNLNVAETMLRATQPEYGEAVVNMGEALEKAAKALLVQHDLPFRWSHDLAHLGERLAEPEPELAERVAALKAFRDYARERRYPGTAEAPERAFAEESLASVAQLVADLEARVEARASEHERPTP